MLARTRGAFTFRRFFSKKVSENTSGHISSISPKEAMASREAAIACILREDRFRSILESDGSKGNGGRDGKGQSNNNNGNGSRIIRGNESVGSSSLQLLMIKRATRLGDPWSGDVALPGGKVEAGETSLQAAIRETKEEVGIDIEGLEYWGAPLKAVTMNRGKNKSMVVRAHIFRFKDHDNYYSSGASSNDSVADRPIDIRSLQSLYGMDKYKLDPNADEIHSCWWQPLDALVEGSANLSTKRIDLSYDRLKQYLKSSVGASMTWIILSCFGISSIHFKSLLLRPQHELTFSNSDDRDRYMEMQSSQNNDLQMDFNQNFVLWGMTLGVVQDLMENLQLTDRTKTMSMDSMTSTNHILLTCSLIGFGVDSYIINCYLLYIDKLMSLLGVNSTAYSRGSAFRRLMFSAGGVLVSSTALVAYLFIKLLHE